MSDDRARRLAQLQKAYESGILDEDTYQTAVAALEPEAKVEAKLEGSGAIAQDHSVAGGRDSVVVGRDVLGSIYHIYQAAPGRSGLTEASWRGASSCSATRLASSRSASPTDWWFVSEPFRNLLNTGKVEP